MEQATVSLDQPLLKRLRFSLQDHLPPRVLRLGPRSSHPDQGVAVEVSRALILRVLTLRAPTLRAPILPGPTALRNGAVHPRFDRLTNFGPLIVTTCVGFMPTTYAQSTCEDGPFSRREVTFLMEISGI